jgi:glycosyltransferase involved in cell wall biosynthesis
MKIQFLNLYGGRVQRGSETFNEALAEKLKKRRHKIVWYKGFSEELPKHEFSGSFLKRLQKRAFLDKPMRKVLTFTLKHLPEIASRRSDVIIPMNGFWQVLLLKVFQPIGRYKILITGHSGPGWDERFNLYLKPDVFIATTKPAKTWAKQTCSWTRVELIPYAVDVNQFRNAKPANINLPKPIVLCPAALVPYKRVDLAIKAVEKLGNTSLLILGKGELEKKIKKMGNQLLRERFHLTSVAYNKMPAYYKASDIVTLPSSFQENSPMVFLESLAARKMVVTTDTPRNRWMLGKAGVFCDPANIVEYKDALKKGLLKSRKKNTKKIIDEVVEKFKWKKVLPHYESIIESLIE